MPLELYFWRSIIRAGHTWFQTRVVQLCGELAYHKPPKRFNLLGMYFHFSLRLRQKRFFFLSQLLPTTKEMSLLNAVKMLNFLSFLHLKNVWNLLFKREEKIYNGRDPNATIQVTKWHHPIKKVLFQKKKLRCTHCYAFWLSGVTS